MENFTTELRTSLDSKNGDALCTALDFDCCEKMEVDLANFDNLCLNNGDLPSGIDIDQQILSDFSLENHGNMDLFNVDNYELLEEDFAEEEALLLAKVAHVDSNIPAITDSHLSKFSDFDKKKEVSSENKRSNGSESVKIASENAQQKQKMDWTPDLHRRFVQAVEQLAVDKAAPLRILDLMGVGYLTRHNIASHLQKYRSHRKHLLGYSPMQPAPPFTPLQVWGHPTLDHSMVHMWQKQPLPAAPAAWPDGSFWQHQSVRLPMAPVIGVPHFNPPVFNGNRYRPEDSNSAIHPVNNDVVAKLKPTTLHPLKERVDAAIDEVLSNPWAPLPIGLKAPSLECVMTELQKKGICIVPPASTCLAR